MENFQVAASSFKRLWLAGAQQIFVECERENVQAFCTVGTAWGTTTSELVITCLRDQSQTYWLLPASLWCWNRKSTGMFSTLWACEASTKEQPVSPLQLLSVFFPETGWGSACQTAHLFQLASPHGPLSSSSLTWGSPTPVLFTQTSKQIWLWREPSFSFRDMLIALSQVMGWVHWAWAPRAGSILCSHLCASCSSQVINHTFSAPLLWNS